MTIARWHFWLAASVLLAAGCGDPPPPSVLLITVDTLRADELGAYGASPSPSPNLDALAAESTLYEHALTPLPMTRPAHFSLFTSRYPREHGVLNNRLALPEHELTLAEVFREHGYRTAAFVGVALLSEKSGAEQGFERLDSPARRQRPANEVVDSALAWMGALVAPQPFFAWVHLFDPHQPYRQIDPGLGRVDAAMLRELPQVDWSDLYRIAKEHDGHIPRSVLEHARALYRAETAYADQQVGRLLDGVRSLRSLDDIVVVVTADHGECFENGVFFEHGDCLQEASLRVPLLIRHPRGFEPGARVDLAVSHIDVAPTLLRAAGIALPERFAGTPLQQVEDGERHVLVQHPFYQDKAVEDRMSERRSIKTVAGTPVSTVVVGEEKVGVVGSGWKYLRGGAGEELYRLGPKLDETRNRVADEDAVREDLAAILDALLKRHPLVLLDTGEVDEELRATLEALGYVQ